MTARDRSEGWSKAQRKLQEEMQKKPKRLRKKLEAQQRPQPRRLSAGEEAVRLWRHLQNRKREALSLAPFCFLSEADERSGTSSTDCRAAVITVLVEIEKHFLDLRMA